VLTGPSAIALSAPPEIEAAPIAAVAGVAKVLSISVGEARRQPVAQEKAHRVADGLPDAVRNEIAGKWFDADSGRLVVAVTNAAAADRARVAGAEPRLVARGQSELDRLSAAV
jgi:streptogrisin C